MNRREIRSIARVAAAGVMILLALTGCRLGDRETDVEAVVQISIAPPARMIGVDEFEVDSLYMVIHDEWDMVWEMEWFVGDGPQTWTIPLRNTGEHWLTVQHHGWNGEESVEATEDSPFWITSGIITRITVTPGAIGVVQISEGEGPPPPVCDPLIPLVDCEALAGTWDGFVEMPGLEGGWVERYMVMEFVPGDYVASYVYALDMTPIEEQTMRGYWVCNDGIVEGTWTEQMSGGVWVPLEWGYMQWHAGGFIEGDVWYGQSDFQGGPDGGPDGCTDMYVTLIRVP